MSEGRNWFGKILEAPDSLLRSSRMGDIQKALKADPAKAARLMQEHVATYKLPDTHVIRGVDPKDAKERDLLLEMAKEPKILAKLPVEKIGYRAPLPTMPDAELFRERLTMFSPEELSRVRERTIGRIKKGKISVAVNGKTDIESVQLSPENEDVLLNIKRKDIVHAPGGESNHNTDELVPGYRTFRERFTEQSYREFVLSWGTRRFMSRSQQSEHEALDGQMYDTLRYSLIVSAEDVYLKPKSAQVDFERGGQIERSPTVHGGKLLAGEFYPTEHPMKCFRVFIRYPGGLRNDVREAYIEFLMPICSTVSAYDSMNSRKASEYEEILRALRTDPGFLLDVLRDALPKIFTSLHGSRNDYYPQPDQNKIFLLIPELRAAGVPQRVLFTPKNKT